MAEEEGPSMTEKAGERRSVIVGGPDSLPPKFGGPDSVLGPSSKVDMVMAFIAEYPAVLVFGALLLVFVVMKIKGQAARSKRSPQQAGRPAGRATLGTNTDANRGAQFVHDVRRTQWLEAQQKMYEEQAAQKAEQERLKKQHAAALAAEEAKRKAEGAFLGKADEGRKGGFNPLDGSGGGGGGGSSSFRAEGPVCTRRGG
eukprot:CAMPEP_0202869008 /NCGR_PEP_ID=MMETSP1391-20130828/11572_1 /ASSEMBLY_ACC=CAM_ASM_000867 /TAXON_ID=1034604 /ORGANISM="Chlamydomonas leiostraca, Strain SAG 11-49" /LENGTH=199 /DNA_ID=CAMNT_0049549245 /DNA_START=16 /DNA_END=615 /DNA_ORIENTATION=+